MSLGKALDPRAFRQLCSPATTCRRLRAAIIDEMAIDFVARQLVFTFCVTFGGQQNLR